MNLALKTHAGTQLPRVTRKHTKAVIGHQAHRSSHPNSQHCSKACPKVSRAKEVRGLLCQPRAVWETRKQGLGSPPWLCCSLAWAVGTSPLRFDSSTATSRPRELNGPGEGSGLRTASYSNRGSPCSPSGALSTVYQSLKRAECSFLSSSSSGRNRMSFSDCKETGHSVKTGDSGTALGDLTRDRPHGESSPPVGHTQQLRGGC